MLQTLDQKDPVVIVAARRTPIGSFQGCLSTLDAPQLAACCIKACLQDLDFDERSKNVFTANVFSESLVGCVLSAGQGQAPARQATRAAGLPDSVGATTVNKMCGSGLKTVMMACDALAHNANSAILAGGMESMSRAPYLLGQARAGLRLGHGRLIDHMLCDGLEDAYPQEGKEEGKEGENTRKSMGVFAEETAQELQISRKEMDDFAIRSLNEARRANEDGSFAREIVPVAVSSRKQETIVIRDEQPFKSDIAKIPHLKGAFVKEGSVTAANASSISDGAAMLVLTRRSFAEKQGWQPLAIIHAASSHAREPQRFTLAPVEALQKLEQACGWTFDSVDLFEINEAFAIVTLAAQRALRLPTERVNVNGGACALGHPIGASGARILTTLLFALRARGLKRGMAAICIGGGEAIAIAIEACAIEAC